MPLHDYHCFPCNETAGDQYRSIEEGAQARPPICPACDLPMSWIPNVGAMDAFEPGQEFTVYDGQNRPVVIESYAQMKQLERDSEQQSRNGEGQPMRFRALHQNRSNKEVNTFGEIPQEKPTEKAKHRFGLQNGAKPLDGRESAPDIPFGPGVHEGNASALKGGL